MALAYKLLPDGGFVVGDVATGWAAYAYPSSPSAELAKRDLARAAQDMHKRGTDWSGWRAYPETLARYWRLLNGK